MTSTTPIVAIQKVLARQRALPRSIVREDYLLDVLTLRSRMGEAPDSVALELLALSGADFRRRLMRIRKNGLEMWGDIIGKEKATRIVCAECQAPGP